MSAAGGKPDRHDGAEDRQQEAREARAHALEKRRELLRSKMGHAAMEGAEHDAMRSEVLRRLQTLVLSSHAWETVYFLAVMLNEGGTTTPELLKSIADAFQHHGEG